MQKTTLAFVLALLASPWLRAGAADLNAPAEFRILPFVVAEDPGPYTATMSEGPVNSWVRGGSFEPMVFRRKMHAGGDSPNEIVVSRDEIDGYNTWKSGLWDGAHVRVYRIREGKLVKVREDTIKAHHASGWNWGAENIRSRELIVPEVTEANLMIAGWSRKDVDYHFTVRAIDKNGGSSAPAEHVTAFVGKDYPRDAAKPPNRIVKFDLPRETRPSDALSAPTGLTYELDKKTGRIRLSWNAVTNADLAGYQVGVSDYAPEEHCGFHLYLSHSPTDELEHIKTGDMIFLEKECLSWDRRDRFSSRVFDATVSRSPHLTFHSDDTKQWSFVEHPAPLPPEFTDHGKTCIRVDMKTNERVRLFQYNHASLAQTWYNVLQTNKTYIVEFRARQEGLPEPTVSFRLGGPYSGSVAPIGFSIDGQWRKYRAEWTVPHVLKERGSVGTMELVFTGPGSVWIDNFRVYEAGTDFLDFPQEDYDALRESGMAVLRTHATIKSAWGYTMDSYLNPIGAAGHYGKDQETEHTLPSLLRVINKAGMEPWLQIEMCMDEREWLAFVEYVCAPYDPDTDTPNEKPWAHKRYAQGYKTPWIDEFERILFEISNETWNPLFHPFCFNWINMPEENSTNIYGSGEIYGLFQEHVIETMKSSPYWTDEVDSKFEFVIGGWAIAPNYGSDAARYSPSTRHVTLAAYNGGWDEKEAPATANDEGYFKALSQTEQVAKKAAIKFDALREKDLEKGISYVLGTYEAGPGYSMPNTITKEQEEQESYTMMSLAAGTATLDNFLLRGYHGFKLQNFFTFGRSRHYWHSHARMTSGGQAYPSWKALSMYNRYGTGDFLLTQSLTAPTWNLPQRGRKRDSAVDGAPMMACYATRKGNDYHLYLLSRKLDNYPVPGDAGYTPVTVRLPFKKPKSITLHKMEGNPRNHNLDSDVVRIERVELARRSFSRPFVLNEETGASEKGLPPSAAYLYVFKDVKDIRIRKLKADIRPASGQEEPATSPDVSFLVSFNQPVEAFGADDLVVSGSAGATTAVAKELPSSRKTTYLVTAAGVLGDGAVTITIPKGATRSASDESPNSKAAGSIEFKLPEGVGLPLLRWDFQDSHTNNLEGRTVPANSRLPIVQETELSPGPGSGFSDNGYYNQDAVSLYPNNSEKLDTDRYIAWEVIPRQGVTLALTKVRMGLWSRTEEGPMQYELRWSRDDFATSHVVPMNAARAEIRECPLQFESGIPAVADLSGFEKLQQLSEPVVFRLYLWGNYGQYTAGGIGKLGHRGIGDDLVVEGMLVGRVD